MSLLSIVVLIMLTLVFLKVMGKLGIYLLILTVIAWFAYNHQGQIRKFAHKVDKVFSQVQNKV